ncbi:DUF2214 domain-containing protein [Devosia sp.]|uniref:DUF2214 domain-containing protein n=1 Tax=Devosia sp. TaxID=1871048 RepID=UPI002FC701C8
MLEAIGQWPGALLLRQSSTLYLFVNAAHILGVGLLLGPILLLDARLLGALRSAPLGTIGPILAGAAKFGVALAVITGLALFSVRPAEYVANPAFLAKLVLLALAIANALALDFSADWKAATAGGLVTARLRAQAALSGLFWLAALVAGRWIGFV